MPRKTRATDDRGRRDRGFNEAAARCRGKPRIDWDKAFAALPLQ